MAKDIDQPEENNETNDGTPSFFRTQKFDRDGLKRSLRVFRYLLPYKGIFILGLIFLVLSTATSLVFPKLVGSIVEVVEGKSNFTINQITVFLIIVLVFQAVFSFFRIYLFTRVSERSMADIRRELYAKIISLPLVFFEKNRVGDLTSRITTDVTLLDSVLSFTLAELFRQIVTLVVGTALLTFTSWKLTLFMLATFPLMVVSAMLFGRYIRRLSRKAQDELAKANVVVEETFQSIQVVKAFTNERLELKRYNTSLDIVVSLLLRAATYRGGFVSFIIFAMFGGIVGVIWYGANLVQSGQMSIADLFTFVIYTAFIGAALGSLGDIYAQINRTIGASTRVLEILDEPSEIDIAKEDLTPAESMSGKIQYENVRFSYPSRPDIRVLNGISFAIDVGEKIALVGPSGAGKSTIVQLLMRFYENHGGSILIDDSPINQMPVTALRKNIAIVPQEVLLFGGTIEENILYGKHDASRAEVLEAAKKANALTFIEEFPEGLQTIVGERGVKLSGGQRQRIAIARAILKNPKILILDEATSSLDAESERLVQEALDGLMKNRTTIIIAHRLATIRKVDKIYVIKEGTITESGTHEELLAVEDGLYAGLIKLQFEASATASIS